jgi:hypothetical protein
MNEMKKHEIIINDEKTVEQIQEDFNKIFPFLKIEFISGLEMLSANLSKKTMKSSGKTIKELSTKNNRDFIHITPQTTTAELVQLFYENYNLTVDILRHSGKAWLKTSKTNYWTLEQQNKLGEELSK